MEVFDPHEMVPDDEYHDLVRRKGYNVVDRKGDAVIKTLINAKQPDGKFSSSAIRSYKTARAAHPGWLPGETVVRLLTVNPADDATCRQGSNG